MTISILAVYPASSGYMTCNYYQSPELFKQDIYVPINTAEVVNEYVCSTLSIQYYSGYHL